jgi:hypothetical protein
VTANAATRDAAVLAVGHELDRRRIRWTNLEVRLAPAQLPDDRVAIVVTKPRGPRLTFVVQATLGGE